MSGPQASDRKAHRRLEALHVPTLAAFAVAQPLFDLTARHAQLYVARGAEGADVALLALVLGLGLPLLLGLVEPATAALWRPLGGPVRSLMLAILVALIALPTLRTLTISPWASAALAAALGAGFAAVYARAAPLRLFLSVLAPALLVFPIVFLTRPPIRRLFAAAEDFPRPAVEIGNPFPVVLVVLDELPLSALLDEHLDVDAETFPHFAALAATSHWFRNASTVSDDTATAVPAILTGRYPAPSDRRTASLANHPENLFTLLGTAMSLNVSEAITRLCPAEYHRQVPAKTSFGERSRGLYRDLWTVYLHLVTPPPWSDSLPRIDMAWAGFETPPQASNTDPVSAFMDRIAEQPDGLHVLHLMLPHPPWQFLPSGLVYNDPYVIPGWQHPTLEQNTWDDDPRLVELAYQRFLAQLRHTDRVLGEMRARLEAAGVWDDAFFVVVADHGTVFRPATRRRGSEPDDFERDVMPVPLFVKRPGQTAGSVSRRNVETVDVVPTLLEALGVEPPWPLDGDSVFSTAPQRDSKSYFVSTFMAPQYQPYRAPYVLRGIGETVRWKLERFRRGAEGALFAFGPHRDLVGRSLGAIPVGGPSSIRAVLLRSELYGNVDRGSGFVPAYVLGELEAEAAGPEPYELAVAVGGEVRAVTSTYRAPGGELRFAALVADDAFRDGANVVRIFEIRGQGNERVLAPADTVGYEEHWTRRFESLLDDGNGWRFAVPFDEVRALRQSEVAVVQESGTTVLEIESSGLDPVVEVPFPERAEVDEVMVKIEITAPSRTDLHLFYLAGGETAYLPRNSRGVTLEPGSNTVRLIIRADDVRGPLRLDPGTERGTYRICVFELRGTER